MNRVLAVRGQVVPATATPLTLHARLADGIDGGRPVAGSCARPASSASGSTPGGRARHRTTPSRAIAEAELIVLGPGSLYTSLLPSLLMPGHPRGGRRVAARRVVFVCNVATQAGETGGFDLADHVEALVAHTAPGLVDVVLANNRFDAPGARPAGRPSRSGCAGRRPVDARRRGSSSTTSWIRTTPTTTTRRAWPRAILGACEREGGHPAPAGASHGRADGLSGAR